MQIASKRCTRMSGYLEWRIRGNDLLCHDNHCEEVNHRLMGEVK